jgi:hypothetical protein
MVGRTVLQYQFIEKLGAGGMGDIYKAQDTRLNRFVAIKVLSGHHAGDADRRRRFIQEAQAASALNHPNIITIHDIITEGDTQFMVLEYVAGKTLVDLIPKGGLRVPQALKYASQMIDALSAAHAAGIIHRDLKPANVMVTDSGLVKILDFGLAKLTDRNGPMTQVGENSDNTMSMSDSPLTVEGSILGTVSYMSPEQAQGKKVDARSDIFSFGVVLYEMLTGIRAFAGENALSTLSAILRDEAKSFDEVAPDVPPQVQQLVSRCLRKVPDQRWQSMQDVRMALAAIRHESESGQLYQPRIPAAARKPIPSKLIAGIAIGVLVLIGAGLGVRQRIKRKQDVSISVLPSGSTEVRIGGQGDGKVSIVTAPDAAAPGSEPATPPAPPVAADTALSNNSIIEMVDAKVPGTVILSQIHASKTDFNLSAAEVIRMTKAGVPANIIEAMRNPKAAPAPVRASTPPAPKASTSSPAPVDTSSTSSSSVTPVATSSTPTPAAPPPSTPAPAPATVPSTEKLVVITVPDGSPIRITLAADIPADAEEGLALRFTAAADFRAGDVTVVPKGASVTGAIVDAQGKKKFLGIGGGKMTFQLTQIDAVDGHKLNVRATPVKRADGQAARPVDTGNQKHSKDVAAAAGAQYIAYVEGDQTVSVRK